MKTMEKILAVLVMMTAAASFSSCNKEGIEQNPSGEVITINIAPPISQGTKVAVSDAPGTKLTITGWAAGDKVTLCKVYESVAYTSEFTWVSGTTFSGALPEHASSIEDVDYAIYNGIDFMKVSKLPEVKFNPKKKISTNVNDVIVLAGKNDGHGNFSLQYCGSILKITNSSGSSVDVSVKDKNEGANPTTYTIGEFTCGITSAGISKIFYKTDFNTAKFTIPIGVSYVFLTGTGSSLNFGLGKTDTESEASVVPFGTVSDVGGKIYTYTIHPDGVLSGEFSVSSTKKVHFSKGNLYWDGNAFKFEDNQYSYATDWSTSHISHFYWSKTANVTYAKNYSDGSTATDDVFFTNATETTPKSDFTVNGAAGVWRTLSVEEWGWLIGPVLNLSPDPGNNCRTTSTVNGTGNARYAKVNVNGVCGLLIFPDVFAWTSSMGTAPSNCNNKTIAWANVPTYTTTEFSAMESAGCVFLPVAGYLESDGMKDAGTTGIYWSSDVMNATDSYCFKISADYIFPTEDDKRNVGGNVRLVTDY